MKGEIISTENRLLAALAHASVTAQGIGILMGLLVYVSQRDKSRYAAYQGLQAAVYQLVNLIITIGMWMVWGVFYGVSIMATIRLEGANPGAAPPVIFWIGLISMVIPIIYTTLVVLYGLWGALRTWQGKDFRYRIIGTWLEKSGLWKETPPPEKDKR